MHIYRNSAKYGPDGKLLSANFGLDIFCHGYCHKPIYNVIEEIKTVIEECHRRD